MAKIKEKEEVIENIKQSSSSQLAVILKENKEDHFNFQERVDWRISTGSLLLDSYMGGGIGPSLVRLTGSPNEGKSPQAIEILRNFLISIPNSRGFWVLSEGRLSEENKTRCGLKFVTDPEEWQDGTVFILESNVYELVIRSIKELVLQNEEKKVFGFVIDSIDGLCKRDDLAKTIDQSAQVAGAPALSKRLLQSLSVGMFKYGHLLIATSQLTSEIKLDPYAKSVPRMGNFSGGNSLSHWADVILEYQSSYNSDYILDNPTGKLNDGKSKPIGKWSKVLIQKSTAESSRKQLVKYPIKFGKKPSGIWIEQEIIDLIWAFELAKQKGPWITISEQLVKDFGLPEQLQGEVNFRKFLEGNPKITEKLFNHFKSLICHKE